MAKLCHCTYLLVAEAMTDHYYRRTLDQIVCRRRNNERSGGEQKTFPMVVDIPLWSLEPIH